MSSVPAPASTEGCLVHSNEMLSSDIAQLLAILLRSLSVNVKSESNAVG